MSAEPASAVARGGAYRLGDRPVARLGFGAMQLRRLASTPDEAIALLERAVELGVDHIDTAQFYGDGAVNEFVGRIARANDAVVVASKVGADPNPGARIPVRPAQRPEQLRASVEDNLRSLGLNRIPVVNLRRLDVGPGLRAEGDQVVDLDDQLATMVAMRDEGKIGSIGLSAVDRSGVERALPIGIVCVQNAYSLVNRESEDVLGLCLANDIAWVPFFPLGGDYPGLPKVNDQPELVGIAGELGISPSQLGLAWLLAHARNVLLIPGTADRGHLEENVSAAAVGLGPEVLARLDAYVPPTVADMAPEPAPGRRPA